MTLCLLKKLNVFVYSIFAYLWVWTVIVSWICVADGTERCVWNFTIRDSPPDYINVSYWGSPDYIENIAKHFHIGDVGL